jgi:hypothetical protein
MEECQVAVILEESRCKLVFFGGFSQIFGRF